jgi:PIN domain nuclease of toxin-antitoxin system
MKYLIDTHVLIWALFDSKKIPLQVSETILNADNEIYVSLISFWEIALKYSIGKLTLKNIEPDDIPDYCTEAGFEIIYPTVAEAASFYHLPVISHKDPFDRMIIWQCIRNDITLISKDNNLSEYKNYGLKIFW